MNKKHSFLSAILLLVFSLVLLHDVVPHHHHDNIVELTNHSHHSHNHEHDHHHDKEDQDHSDHNQDHQSHYSHLSHFAVFTEFVFDHHTGYQNQDIVDQFVISDIECSINNNEIVAEAPPNEHSYAYVSSYFYSHLLRGPPSLYCSKHLKSILS